METELNLKVFYTVVHWRFQADCAVMSAFSVNRSHQLQEMAWMEANEFLGLTTTLNTHTYTHMHTHTSNFVEAYLDIVYLLYIPFFLVFICLGFHDRMPEAKWLIYKHIFVSQSWSLGCPRSRCQQIQCLLRTSFLAHKLSSFCCVLTW